MYWHDESDLEDLVVKFRFLGVSGMLKNNHLPRFQYKWDTAYDFRTYSNVHDFTKRIFRI